MKIKKILGITIAMSLLLIATGCSNKNTYISELEDEISDLESIIENCNSNIEDAKSYAWESYEEMGDALDYLETCNYY